MHKRRIFPTVFILLLSFIFFAAQRVSAADTAGSVVISQFQAASSTSASEEFIELYNNTDAEIDMTDWCLQYGSAAGAYTKLTCFTATDANTKLFLPARTFAIALSSTLATNKPTYVKDAVFASGLALNDRHVRLVDSSGNPVDTLGWGPGATAAEGLSSAPSLAAGKMLIRISLDSLTLKDTNSNSADFIVATSQIDRLHGLLYEVTDICTNLVGIQAAAPVGYVAYEDGRCLETEPDPVTPTSNCEGIVFSEILPNAIGSDVGHEYIELLNPTDKPLDLLGCALQSSATSAKFTFVESTVVGPDEYVVLYDSVTGLTLPNASGGTVWLLSADDAELDSIVYPGDMPDDTGWMLFAGLWQLTYEPTPQSANIVSPLKPCSDGYVRSETSGRCVLLVNAAVSVLSPCDFDEFRNPETNRCKKIQTNNVSSLASCKEGQERNPETNRCRSVLAASTSLVPCDDDEFRNPETNRCKKIAGSVASLTPCKAGQERNPETNRCRNSVDSAADIAPVTDVVASQRTDYRSVWIAGFVLFIAAAYAVYEWRKDIVRWLRGRFTK